MKITNIIVDLDNSICRCSEYYIDAQHRFADMASLKTGIPQPVALNILRSIDLENSKLNGFGRDKFPMSFKAASLVTDVFMGKKPSTTRAEQAWVIGNSVFKAPYKLFGGAYDALDKLNKAGIGMFLCTKGDSQMQMQKIKKNKLTKIFPDGHIYIDAVKNETHFLKILTEHKLNKAATLIVGDSLKDDIGSANILGVKSVYISGQGNSSPIGYEDVEGKPNYIIETISQLPDLVL